MRLSRLRSVAIVSTVLLAGCSGPPDAPGAPTLSPAEAVRATAALDWNEASILLPLDAFGMSIADWRAVSAASSIEFARCVTDNTTVAPAVVAEASRALRPVTPDPRQNHWLYGIWNAAFVAQHGWRPFPEEDPEARLVVADPATTARCLKSPAVTSLGPIATTVADDGPSSTLVKATADSRTRTLATPGYAALMDALQACLAADGRPTVRDAEGVRVDFPADASEEALLTGMVASASCNDNGRITQQAADIEASFQHDYILQNQAELLAVKAAADERAARARQILKDVGL